MKQTSHVPSGTRPSRSGRVARPVVLVVVALAAVGLVGSPVTAKPLGRFSSFRTPTDNAAPHHITNGPDGNLWYTFGGQGEGEQGVARITPTGDITEFSVCSFCSTSDIVTHDGALWYTHTDSVLPNGWGIGRITPDGSFSNVPLPEGIHFLRAITSDGSSLWLTDFDNNSILRYTPSAADPGTGTFTSFEIPTPGANPFDVAVAADGAIWFTELHANQIGRLDPATGVITETPVQGSPRQIAIAPDGRVWFTERFDHAIGSLDPSTNQVQLFPTAPGAGPEDIAAAPDGNLWFTQMGPAGDNIARISGSGTITQAKRVKGSGPFGITIDPEGDPWYTMLEASKIATIDLP